MFAVPRSQYPIEQAPLVSFWQVFLQKILELNELEQSDAHARELQDSGLGHRSITIGFSYEGEG